MDVIRCKKCVLPASAPFIDLDADGVCRHCRSDTPTTDTLKHAELERIADELKSSLAGSNCIVGLSGGRDSCYVLHYVVKELGLKPVVFTYDWGMLTPTGARNQDRMVQALGLERVNVADNIDGKRRNIRRNLLAWLKRPELGMIPLLMAGDKHFFASARTLKKELNQSAMFFGITDIEAEDFKEGFCGIKAESFVEDKKHYRLFMSQKAQILAYYAKQFLLNPRYINLSIPETIYGFYAYYVMPHEYATNLFAYVPWNEEQIVSTLRESYNWESEPDSPVTWRTGDASQPLISFLYLALADFTENDFLRSNQIRRGMLDRDTALTLLTQENVVRMDGLRYCCDLIGVDADMVVSRVKEVSGKFELPGI